MHHTFELADDVHPVALSRSSRAYRLHHGEEVIDINLQVGPDGCGWLTIGDEQIEIIIATCGDQVFVHLCGEAYELRYQHPLDRLAAEAGGSDADHVVAPMSGSIVSVAVKAGDAVMSGQTLLVMESMKMEMTITAPRDGFVADVIFGKGESFDRDALLVTLQTAQRQMAQDTRS